MSFSPVLHPLLLVLLWAPVVALAVFALTRNPARRGSWGVRIAVLAVCFLLALRPGIPGGESETLATDTDIVLVVDTTASIVAEDWDGDQPRLEGVRADIAAIMEEYPGARFALVTFDATAELRLPMTTDTTALATSLAVLKPEVTAQSIGSSVGVAHDMVESTLRHAADLSPDRARMVFYFGDGEQTAASSPESFADSADLVSGGGVFGYGTVQGGPMKITRTGAEGTDLSYIEYQGAPALSTIDETNLQDIASQLGVDYQYREAQTAPELPPAPTTTTTDGRSTESILDLSWMIALLVLVLIAVDIALQAGRWMRLRAATAPRPEVSR